MRRIKVGGKNIYCMSPGPLVGNTGLKYNEHISYGSWSKHKCIYNISLKIVVVLSLFCR